MVVLLTPPLTCPVNMADYMESCGLAGPFEFSSPHPQDSPVKFIMQRLLQLWIQLKTW
jgi:hypothetical protein